VVHSATVVFFNYTTMQITAKIVYYGPGLCGKTTNLHHIHQKTAPRSRGEMVSLETETDRTLFFDLLPLDVGVIGGMKVRLQLYTVPGQVFYNATRKLVLKGVDGVGFVADSQSAAAEANVESLVNLKANLAELNVPLDQIPLVFQYNKRDLRNIQTVEQLTEALNRDNHPAFEAAALHGIGVFETLKAISRHALASIRRRLAEDTRRAEPALAAAAIAAAPSPIAAMARVASPPVAPAVASIRTAVPPATVVEPIAAGGADLLAHLIAAVPPAEDLPVEFAEEDTDKHAVRPVRMKENLDIHDELAKLRTLATGVSVAHLKSEPAAQLDVEKRLQDVIVAVEHPTKLDVKRKASVVVPADLLRNSSLMKIRIAFDGDEQWAQDAVTLRLTSNRKLERLNVHLELELKTKTS
jgi:signal recognition particle receptor subunit beta